MINFAIQIKHQREFDKCKSGIPAGSRIVGEAFWDPEDMVDAFVCMAGHGPPPQPTYQNGIVNRDDLRCVSTDHHSGYGDVYFWYEPAKEPIPTNCIYTFIYINSNSVQFQIEATSTDEAWEKFAAEYAGIRKDYPHWRLPDPSRRGNWSVLPAHVESPEKGQPNDQF